MIRLPAYGSTDPDGHKSETFEYGHDDFTQQLPAYDSHNPHHHQITTPPALPLITIDHD